MKNPSTKNAMKPIRAWAVVDAAGGKPLHVFDLSPSRSKAAHLRHIRETVAFPKYPNAKWRIARVEIREVK